ncbi:MAG: VCBS repeat-containing protein, partial [Bacteroidales bacterium]|nr:VCBS repeat-containing protein [Bacteroidales bacterium]
MAQSQSILHKYITVCEGQTGTVSYLDTLFYENFNNTGNLGCLGIFQCGSCTHTGVSNQVCVRGDNTICQDAYEGYSFVEQDQGFADRNNLENYRTSLYTPEIPIAVPDQTSVSFVFYNESYSYLETGYYMDDYGQQQYGEYLETVWDEVGLSYINQSQSYINTIWGENCEDCQIQMSDRNEWTPITVNLNRTLPAGNIKLAFSHINEGGTAFGLDEILVYGPRIVSIPANVSAAAAGSTIETTMTYYRKGCEVVTVTIHWFVAPPTADTLTVSAELQYKWEYPAGNGATYTESGIYSKTGMTNSNGCDSTAYLDLTITNSGLADAAILTASIPTCTTTRGKEAVEIDVTWKNIGSVPLLAPSHMIVYAEQLGGTVVWETARPMDSDQPAGVERRIRQCGIELQELCAIHATKLVYAINANSDGIAQETSTLQEERYIDNNVYTMNLPRRICGLDTNRVSDTACDTYTWQGETFTRDTSLWKILRASDDDDSLVKITITIKHSTARNITTSSCDSYTWSVNGDTYTGSGTHSVTRTNAAGCDSVITLQLTINSTVKVFNHKDTCEHYYWTASDSTYLASTKDTLRGTTVKGCDSLTILDLFIGHATTAPDSVQIACDSFLWRGQTLKTSGHYLDTATNVENCDSLMSLSLTIGHNSPETRSDTGVCDSFLWAQTARIYRTSGIYSDTLANINGCDSVIVLGLSVQSNLEAPLLTSMICDEYTWSENGQTYTESGIYTDTLRSMYDCDSIVRLDLTILTSPQLRVTPDTTINICGKATIEARGAQCYLFSPATALSQTLIYDTVATVYANPRTTTNYLITAYSLGPELVYNGDFTLGKEGFTTDLRYMDRLSGYGVYSLSNIARSVASNEWHGKEHTTPLLNSGKFMVIDGSETANHLVWRQSIDVKPYTEYIFSFWATRLTSSNPAKLQTVINNVAVGEVLVPPSPATESGNWVQRYFIWNSGSSTTADIKIINQLGLASGNDFGIDDISLRQLSCATEHHVSVNVHIDTLRQHVCDAFTWRETGMTYSESGHYDRHVRTTSGCDSLRVLDLTIANTNIDTDYVTTCHRHFWTLDSTMYTESGLYLWRTNHEEEGCDTFRYLRLTILDCDSVPLPDNVDDPLCTNLPPANAFALRQLFQCRNVNSMSTPMIGDVDGDGVPEIVACRYQNVGCYESVGNGMLVFDGQTGALKYTLEVPSYAVSGQCMSLCDADRNGRAEFYMIAEDNYLYCFDATGLGQLWRSREKLNARYIVMSADVNGDGNAEIVCGPYIFDAITGTLLLQGTQEAKGRGFGRYHQSCWNRVWYMQALADIDFDGSLEICAGNTIYKPVITNNSGTAGNSWNVVRQAETLSSIDRYDGQTFLVDFDNDGDVDVCVIGYSSNGTNASDGRVDLYVWEGQTSEILGYVTVGIDVPSIPFAGDLDGNGTPDIIFNSMSGMRAYTYDPSLPNKIRLMHHGTRFGETAGFTVFDFNQDGKEEIVYRNTNKMFIVDGSTLADLCTPVNINSGTVVEYPTVADVNGDGHAEIIVCHDQSVSVFASQQQNAWGSARKVWNQWAYNSVNINEDLTIPRHQFDVATTFPNGKKPFNGFLRQMPRLDLNGDIYMTVPDVDVAPTTSGIEYSDTGAIIMVDFCNRGESMLPSPYYITVYADEYKGEIVKTYSIAHQINTDTCVSDTLFIPRHILCHLKNDSLAIAVNDAGFGVAQTGGQQSECDTTNNVVKIPFTPLIPPADTLRVTRCDKYIWSAIDTALFFSAVLNDTIPDHEGCDSVRWLELTVNHSVFDTLDTIVCDIFQWRVNGEVYTADKVQTEYFNTIHGCDSIHHLILEMHYRFDTTEYREACNTFYWPVDRRTYTRSATHAERMLTLYGCDSIHELILTVYHTYRDTMYDTICHYDSRAFGGHSYNMSGHYYDTVPMMRECDTIHELFLHVKQELPLEIDWTSQCEQLQYTIFAFNPRGDSLRGQINWQAFPVDHELDWQAY